MKSIFIISIQEDSTPSKFDQFEIKLDTFSKSVIIHNSSIGNTLYKRSLTTIFIYRTNKYYLVDKSTLSIIDKPTPKSDPVKKKEPPPKSDPVQKKETAGKKEPTPKSDIELIKEIADEKELPPKSDIERTKEPAGKKEIIINQKIVVSLNIVNTKSFILLPLKINNINYHFINAHFDSEKSTEGYINRINDLNTVFNIIDKIQVIHDKNKEESLYILSGDLNFRSPKITHEYEELSSLIGIIGNVEDNSDITGLSTEGTQNNDIVKHSIINDKFRKIQNVELINKLGMENQPPGIKGRTKTILSTSNIKGSIEKLKPIASKYIIHDFIYDNDSTIASCKLTSQNKEPITEVNKQKYYDDEKKPSYCDRILFIIPKTIHNQTPQTFNNLSKTIYNIVNTSDHFGVEYSKKYLKYKKKYLGLKNF